MAHSEGSVISAAHSGSRPSNGVTESETRAAAAGEANRVGYRVLLPPAKFIPLSVTDIVDSIKNHIPHSERAVFTEICQIIEGKALTEFMGIRRRVKKNFRFFSAAAMHRDLPTRRGKGLKKEDTMDEMEVVFLRDLWELMEYAHYSALSEADWLAAKQERLMLDMPIKINWDHCDPGLFSRFYNRFPERTEGLYRFKENLMIFHRGVGVIRKKDLFIAQKVDLLVKYLVAWPAKQVFYKMAPYLWQSAREQAAAMKQKDVERSTDPNSLIVGNRALEHKNANHITRVSLRLLMPTWRSVFSRLFKPCEIVEPTYKDIISVYRKSVKPPTEKELAANPTLGDKFRRDRRGIVVKRFDELPVADLEIILPDKTIGLKLIDNLTLYGTAVAALVGGIVAFFGANVDLNFVISTLGVVSGKLFQTYSKMEAKKAELMKQMSQTVFDISMDAQEGAIYSVLDEMADQFVKEMLLAYFLLLKHKYPATEDELDELCEQYLEDRFDVKIDFAIEDSLPRLLRDGLVEPGADADDPRIKAVPLEVAHERLLAKWKTAFAYDASSTSTLSEQLLEPVAALKGGLTHLGGAMSSVTAFIPGMGKKSKRSWFSRKSKNT